MMVIDLTAAGAHRAGHHPPVDVMMRHRRPLEEAVRRAVAHTGALNAQVEEAFTGHAS
jgi:hypothetical protein